jgi:hypothetical protein
MRNLENGQVSEVTITVTKTHHEQLLRQGIANQESVNLRFSPIFLDTSLNHSLQDRYQLFHQLFPTRGGCRRLHFNIS